MIHIKTKTETLYSIGEDLPNYSILPHGENTYNKLLEYHDLEQLENLIDKEIVNITHSLHKYDHDFEPEHRGMCDEMKAIQTYLKKCFFEVYEIKKQNKAKVLTGNAE